jgi:hypothetical protein
LFYKEHSFQEPVEGESTTEIKEEVSRHVMLGNGLGLEHLFSDLCIEISGQKADYNVDIVERIDTAVQPNERSRSTE